jgi:hypothetical protein
LVKIDVLQLLFLKFCVYNGKKNLYAHYTIVLNKQQTTNNKQQTTNNPFGGIGRGWWC